MQFFVTHNPRHYIFPIDEMIYVYLNQTVQFNGTVIKNNTQ